MKINMKKAQGSVPVIIIILAVLMIVYLYSMPKSEKCSLMPDLKECSTGEEQLLEKTILFSDTPGFLAAQEKSAVYSIKPFELINKEEVEIATILEKQSAKRTWFDNIEKKAVFPVHEKGKELKIYIFISKSQGKLYVNINPRLKYILEGAGMKELSVPISLLNETNIIRFSVSAPIIPAETNFYDIEKVIIKETYSKTDLYAKRNFSIAQDLSQLEQATLSFYADCLTKEILTLTLNNVQISNKVTCGETEIDITKEIKKDNEIVFASNGNYLIRAIKVNLYFKRGEYTTYYINLEGEDAIKVKQGKKLAMLIFEFDSNANKKFDINVNDNILDAETIDTLYKTNINIYLMEGLNKIRIVPRNELEIKKLELSLE